MQTCPSWHLDTWWFFCVQGFDNSLPQSQIIDIATFKSKWRINHSSIKPIILSMEHCLQFDPWSIHEQPRHVKVDIETGLHVSPQCYSGIFEVEREAKSIVVVQNLPPILWFNSFYSFIILLVVRRDNSLLNIEIQRGWKVHVKRIGQGIHDLQTWIVIGKLGQAIINQVFLIAKPGVGKFVPKCTVEFRQRGLDPLPKTVWTKGDSWQYCISVVIISVPIANLTCNRFTE